METTTIVIIAVAAAVVLVALVLLFLVSRWRRTSGLKNEFGSEYDRTLQHADGRRSAESALKDRQKRVGDYQIRDLEPEEARRFDERWRSVQAEFVDQPGPAVEHADNLLAEVLAARGYESASARERVEDVSVGHGDEAEEYRLARATAIRNRDGVATTEELRRAMLHYQKVFGAMLGREPVAAH